MGGENAWEGAREGHWNEREILDELLIYRRLANCTGKFDGRRRRSGKVGVSITVRGEFPGVNSVEEVSVV